MTTKGSEEREESAKQSTVEEGLLTPTDEVFGACSPLAGESLRVISSAHSLAGTTLRLSPLGVGQNVGWKGICWGRKEAENKSVPRLHT